MKFIVMAGGQGTKLWPYSREEFPKQFQPVVGDRTLFRMNLDDVLSGYNAEDIFISTKRRYVDLVRKLAPEIPVQHIIAEPDAKKNQGPATLYATLKVNQLAPGEPFMLIQSDCIRSPREQYLQMLAECEQVVTETGRLISGGIRPTYPVMGIDYIELANKFDTETDAEFYRVERFVPRYGTVSETKQLIEDFHVVTHSNHYCWYAEKLMDVAAELRPNWYEQLTKIKQVFGTGDEVEKTERLYEQIEQGGNIEEITASVFADSGLMVLLPFKWTDVGTWSSVYEYFSGGSGNYFDGKVVDIDTDDTLVKALPDKLVATIGVKNLVIVDTEDVLLVCTRDEAGRVKEILGQLDSKYL